MNRRKFFTIAGATVITGLIAGKEIYNEFTDNNLDNNIKKIAMAIDLQKCNEYAPCHIDSSFIPPCIAACNQVHNIPVIQNKKHEIKWLWQDSYKHAFIEQDNNNLPNQIQKYNVLLLCNHCDNPPCVRVCPTKATWKRKEDGIVMMDWHRCIGCRYCMAACPYSSRSFNYIEPRDNIHNLHSDFPTRTKGVVEKCNFCEERLSRGLQPACVDACPAKAIVFGDLNDKKSEINTVLQSNFNFKRKTELGTKPEVYYII